MAQPPPLEPYWNDSQTVLLRKILTNLAYLAGSVTGGGTGSPVVEVSPPASSASPGALGQVAQDGSYFYVYTAFGWRRTAINDWA